MKFAGLLAVVFVAIVYGVRYLMAISGGAAHRGYVENKRRYGKDLASLIERAK